MRFRFKARCVVGVRARICFTVRFWFWFRDMVSLGVRFRDRVRDKVRIRGSLKARDMVRFRARVRVSVRLSVKARIRVKARVRVRVCDKGRCDGQSYG